MALLDKAIEVAFVADDSQIQAVMARVGKQSESMGGKVKGGAEAGRLGMWSMGESAENAARSLGVPNKMSEQLSNSVERMAASMGTAAVALGVVGLAAMAAFAIWKKLADQKEKAREELEKSVQSLMSEVDALQGSVLETDELRAAKERLLAIKQKHLEQDFAKYISNEEAALRKLREEAKKGGTALQRFGDYIKAAFMSGGDVEERRRIQAELTAARTEELTEELNRKIEEQEAKLTVKTEENSARRTTAARKEAAERVKASESVAAVLSQMREREALAGMGSDEAELRRIDMRHAAEIERLVKHHATTAQLEEAAAMQKAERDRAMAAQEERMLQARTKAYWDMGGSVIQSFQMLYTAGGSQARKWFTLWKIAAISEAGMKGIQSVINSYEFGTKIGGPAIGSAMATIAGLAVYAKINALKRSEFGAAPSAIGTFPASAGTGLPEQSAGAPTQVNIYVDGRMQSSYELASGVMSEVYRNNGEVGGYSVRVERSA